MIQKNVIYHKSAKGTEAIATRQHGLSPKLRSMLIMIDGKRGFEDLVQLSQMLGDTEQLLGQLLDEGFIEPTASVAAAPAPVAPRAAVAPASAVTRKNLADAQRYVVRRLTDVMGPNAEDLCLRIENARNLHDFEVAVARSEGMLRQYLDAHTVAEFMADVRAHMPVA